jgi:hypothetical protein
MITSRTRQRDNQALEAIEALRDPRPILDRYIHALGFEILLVTDWSESNGIDR